MATRLIVTSQPDVACDVCGRRLLRGEHPDVFLAGGQRRTVCELCAPRAAQEGWLREADSHSLSVRPARRRGVSLLGRLRQLREPDQPGGPARRHVSREPDPREEDLYDFLDAEADAAEPARAYERELDAGALPDHDGDDAERGDTPLDAEELTSGDLKAARAVEVFNAGEQPRRIAGVSRSLGAPSVTVRPLEDSGSLVAIVVAWELCWYRYEVDLGDELAGARQVDKGMELDELAAEDRAGNAVADERGELSLLV